MKLFFSNFKGYQIYNPTVEFTSLGLNIENSKQTPSVVPEEWMQYRRAIVECEKNFEKKLYLIAYRESIGEFSRVDRYKGIKRQLESCMTDPQSVYQDVYIRSENDKHFMYSGCLLNEEDIEVAVSFPNSFVWLGDEEMFKKVMNNLSRYNTPEEIKNDLIANNCILVELLDLGIDGNSLFLLATSDILHKAEMVLRSALL